ncbi:MAG: hypothetical protein FWD57_01020 [Polyangiaceae bacterium]|nr:hypothetical protein [Polyangiaceae bacterium]
MHASDVSARSNRVIGNVSGKMHRGEEGLSSMELAMIQTAPSVSPATPTVRTPLPTARTTPPDPSAAVPRALASHDYALLRADEHISRMMASDASVRNWQELRRKPGCPTRSLKGESGWKCPLSDSRLVLLWNLVFRAESREVV